jgi:thiamine biosynthesis lipoprotein
MTPGQAGRPLARRRFIRIVAAAAGLGWIGAPARGATEGQVVTWRGTALGAAAEMQILHPDRRAAVRLIERAVDEVARLERIFSLYRRDSALVSLNRAGALAAPPPELVELLRMSDAYHRLTGGAFDPSVQPLWTLYAEHFAGDADAAGPSSAAIEATLDRIGWGNVLVSPDRIALRRGMALTLNGIAQGYITDRVVDLLRGSGIDRSFVDLGEARALGPRPDGAPWNIGIADPSAPDRVRQTIAVTGQAVATSGAYGFRFDAAGRYNHLLDPRTGASPARYASVTVVLPTATAADALSTAFSLMPPEAIEGALREIGGGRVLIIGRDGADLDLRA